MFYFAAAIVVPFNGTGMKARTRWLLVADVS
jgi:hypothetical protein